MPVRSLLSLPRAIRTERLERQEGIADFCRTLLRCNPDCVLILNVDGGVEFVNENGQSQFGLKSSDDLAAFDWIAAWPAADRAKVIAALDRAQLGETARFQGCCPTSDGVPKHWDVVISPFSDDANGVNVHGLLLCMARDITAVREAQEKSAQSVRLEALGQLTGGVAHDFNNLLTVIMGASEALADFLGVGTAQEELAQVCLRAADRGADLIRRLLAFSRQQELEPQPVDCVAMVNTIRPLAQHLIREDISLKVQAPNHPLTCIADPAGLESAILNLFINARDAMPHGGSLSLKSEAMTLTGGSAERLSLKAGSYVVFTVRDTGIGMSPETLKRAVEPFFTTKGMAGGSGLGLSTAFGFAEQSGGRLAIISEVGRGTSVSIYLPRIVPPRVHLHAVDQPDFRAGGRILLVEDDDLVRAQVSRQLSDCGYAVSVVSDGPAAVEAIEAGLKIDLLMTDVVMPHGMNGHDVAARARALRPGIKVLLTSGYRDERSGGEDSATLGEHFLAKPYRRLDLVGAIETALQGPRVPSPARRPEVGGVLHPSHD